MITTEPGNRGQSSFDNEARTPLLILLGLALLAWAYFSVGGFGRMIAEPSAFVPGGKKEGQFFAYFFPSLTAMVGFWATLSLNIPDFSRYAYTQRDQVVGQLIGLPTTMALYSFIGVAVTSATTIIYGTTIWDPVDVLTRFQNPVLLVVAMLALCIATLATNIAAITRLIGALLLEQNDEWQTQNRYMQTEPMAEFAPPTVDVVPPQIATVAA